MDDWKLLLDDTAGTHSLHHLPSDPGEATDRSAERPDLVAALRSRFDAWESGTLPPFYGPGDIALDGGLERHAITGGYRLKRDEATLVWLSAPFREALPLGEDFHFGFMARSTETTVWPDGEIACALSDSGDRGRFIRAIIDCGGGMLRLENGLSGESATAALDALPVEFTAFALDFDSSLQTLTFRGGGAVVSLPLAGGYGALSHFAAGAAGMEGEITTLVPGDGVGLGAEAHPAGELHPDTFDIELSFPAMPPFPPLPERSPGLADFHRDGAALVESHGGGRYLARFPVQPAERADFFRFRLNQP